MDRVKFQALERAELGDLLALQGLTYEHIRRALGARERRASAPRATHRDSALEN